MTFFVVDTDKASLLNMEKCLKTVYPNANIVLHRNPLTVIAAVTKVNPDQYISEVSLGNTDGIALAAKVQLIYPRIQITMMSDSREFAVQSYKIHARSYLIKPITPEKIKQYLLVD